MNVEALAHSMCVGRASIEALVQEGNIGLQEATESFDVSRGVPFEKYARFSVLQRMNLYLDSLIPNVPVHIKNKARMVCQAISQLKAENKPVTAEAVSELTGMNDKMVSDCFKHVQSRLKQNEYHPDDDWKPQFYEAVFSYLSDDERELIT